MQSKVTPKLIRILPAGPGTAILSTLLEVRTIVIPDPDRSVNHGYLQSGGMSYIGNQAIGPGSLAAIEYTSPKPTKEPTNSMDPRIESADDTHPVVVILTALNLEYHEIHRRLTDLQKQSHGAGTVFELGKLPDVHGTIAIAVCGEGNPGTSVLAERAITMFQPQALLFVGVAGGLKEDVALGDVVVATKVYGYHGGKYDDHGFLARPRAWEAPHELDQLARHVALGGSWIARLSPDPQQPTPTVHFKPIAAGEVVLNARDSPLERRLHDTYNDAVAIEMESVGISQAGHLNRSVPVLTIRGISDKADGGKQTADQAGCQSTAAAHAAAFGLELAASILMRATMP